MSLILTTILHGQLYLPFVKPTKSEKLSKLWSLGKYSSKVTTESSQLLYYFSLPYIKV